MDNTKGTPTDADVLASKIQLLAGKTKADSNPEELEKLKKLIKKNVPFSLRGYFMAYLLREVLAKENSKPERKPRPQRRNNKNTTSAETTQVAKNKDDKAPLKAKPNRPEKRARVMPEGSKTLYLNIGKMRKLYGKDISKMLQEGLSITAEDIFAIRVHDKYSFITMSAENCEKAIAEFNGKEIKGRTAQVTYSNKD